MSTEFSGLLMIVDCGKDQENNMDPNVELEEKLKDIYVAETSNTKVRVGNTGHSTDPCNMQEDVSVRKRKAGDAEEMPQKRMKRCSGLATCGEHCPVSPEEIGNQRGKRKASVDADTPRKKSRCSINTNTNDAVMVSVKEPSIQTKKRKASGDGSAPGKKSRCSINTKINDAVIVSVEETLIQTKQRKASGDGSPPRKKSRCSINTKTIDAVIVSVEEPSVQTKKRKASGDGSPPRKKSRCSINTKTIDAVIVSVEETPIQTNKRKASGDANTPRKKSRCSIKTKINDAVMLSVEQTLIQTKQRKARGDGSPPRKKMRYSISTCGTKSSTSGTTCSTCGTKSSTSGTDSIPTEWSFSEDDSGEVCLILDNVSPEEEKIYQMSSSGKTSKAHFHRTYLQLNPIGAGGFGSVHAGYRKQNILPMAIKHIPREDVMLQRVVCNGNVYHVILEVALMLKAAGLPGSVGKSAVVSLLDWYTFEQEVVLVMERPVLSKDLSKYLEDRRGSLKEHEAKTILRQLVDAAIDMHSKGIFHRDIKLKNVLVKLNQLEPRVCVIDFGCGNFSKTSSYSSFCGTRSYFPPEWFENKKYTACPTTVWQLGALFYSLLKGHGCFTTTGFISGQIQINPALSQDCKTLLNMCLARDPTQRATLEELQLCPALRETSSH